MMQTLLANAFKFHVSRKFNPPRLILIYEVSLQLCMSQILSKDNSATLT